MGIDLEVQQTPDQRPDAPPEQPAQMPVSDGLPDLRMVKWLTRVIVYPGVTLLIPLDHFVLGMGWLEAVFAHVGGYALATAAIELAFAQGERLRKRSIYPFQLALHVGEMQLFDTAMENALFAMVRLLKLQGAFLALRADSSLTLAALQGLNRTEAERYLLIGDPCVRQAISASAPVSLRRSRDLMAEVIIPAGRQVVFVPLRSTERVIGVLGLLARSSNGDVRDFELLAAIGLALGVTLENLRQKDELRELAAVDELTGVSNRRHFFDQLDREVRSAARYQAPLAVLMLDFDGLKTINDTFGHIGGDEALCALAQRLVRFSRASDLVARIGGDEFAVILPRTDAQGAQDLSHRLQRAVEDGALALDGGRQIAIAISCGAAAFPDDAQDAETLLRQADANMYSAKMARRRAVRRA